MPRPPSAYQERDYARIAQQYAADVVAGKVVSGKWTVKACQRSIDDWRRFRAKESPYVWNPLLYDREGRQYRPGDRVCAFVERLKHYKGPLAGQTIKLEPWQVWMLCNAFGWIRRGTNLRRFRIVYWEVARGNGKTTMTGPVGLYMLCFDQEPAAEVYSAATTRDQAAIVFEDAAQMAGASRALKERFQVTIGARSLYRPDGSRFKALSADAKTLDGKNVHFGIIDELHAHTNRGVYDVLETAIGKRLQAMLWSITTAGTDRAGICYEIRTYLTGILEGHLEDDAFMGCIWAADEDDDPFERSSWLKANPNMGVSVQSEHIEQLAQKARSTPSALANFRTKHLCQWVSSYSAWLDIGKVKKCAGSVRDDDFAGQPCVIALDLASRVDIAVLTKMFWRWNEADEQWHVYLRHRYFLPAEAVEGGKNTHYAGWVKQGLIELTPGNAIEFDMIKDAVLEEAGRHVVEEVAYDPWQAHYFSQKLMQEGFTEEQVIEYRQTVANMSPAMKELQALLYEGRAHYPSEDEVWEWMCSNVIAFEDAKENVYPRKEHKAKKIDAVVSAIMATGRVMLRISTPKQRSIYEERGILSL